MKFITVLVLCTVAIACVSAQSDSAESSKGVTAGVWDQMQTMISEVIAKIRSFIAQIELYIGGLKLTEMLSGTLEQVQSAAKNSALGQGIDGLRSRFSGSGAQEA